MQTESVEKVHAWTARRSGACITILGKDEAGRQVRIPNVETIHPAQAGIVATDRHGATYLLAA